MVEFKFHQAMPIFVARQWIRHRTANVNEYSARYSVVKERFYIPPSDDVRAQSKTNKQAAEGPVEEATAQDFLNTLGASSENAYKNYERALADGIGREQARMLLPLNVYTEWYWKIDLHNLLHFLGLRLDSHAQKEIRDHAQPMYDMIKELAPMAVEAFDDYHPNRGGMLLSRLEVEAIQRNMAGKGGGIESDNKREQAEWASKARQLHM
jgi:thymidylate synthase (FAD)